MRWNKRTGKVFFGVEQGRIDGLAELVTEHPELLRTYLAASTIMHAAARGKNIEALEILVRAGVDVDIPDEYGTSSPLQDAATSESVETVEWLLKRGAYVDGISKGKGASPLASAARRGTLEIVQVLLEHGADVNASYELGKGPSRTKFNALRWAVANGREDIAELLRRHGARMPEEERVPTDTSPASLHEEILRHMQNHAGRVKELALAEVVPSDLDIAVHVISPTPERPSTLLFTTGMSERAMNVPEGAEAYRYAELFLELTPEWPLDDNGLEDERHRWPLCWLRKLARYPHEAGCWLSNYLVVSSEEPPQPIAPGTELCCMMLLHSTDLGELVAADGRRVNFYQVLPMYREERDFLLEQGVDAFAKLLLEHDVDTIIDTNRVNVARSDA